MFPLCLQYLLTEFRQTFVTGASRDRHELIAFWGQKGKVQGHTIAAEAHSTRRCCPVQRFLVLLMFVLLWVSVLVILLYAEHSLIQPTSGLCGITLSVNHILVECTSLQDMSQEYFTAPSLKVLML